VPRARRILFPGAFYHVYNRGVEKRPIFYDDRDRRTFLQLLADTVLEFGIRLFAHCLMDNHFHLFLQTPQGNLDRAMQSLLSQYVHHVNLTHQRVGPLFQGRYKARMVDADSYATSLARYIHKNPLEAGLVERLEDYPWSSYSCYVGKLPLWKWLDAEWLLRKFHSDLEVAKVMFIAFHQQMSPEPERQLLQNLKKDLRSPKGVRPLFPCKRGLTPL